MIRHFYIAPRKVTQHIGDCCEVCQIKDDCGLCRGTVLDVDRTACNWGRAF